MPSEYRSVEVAAGHRVTVRQSRTRSTRPGHIMVEKSHRPPFEIEQRRWDEARPA